MIQRTLAPKFFALLIVLGSLFAFASTSFAQTKIGVVDIKKVMETVPDGKKAMSSLKAEMKKKQAKLDKAKKDFEQMRDKLAKRSVVQQPTADEQRDFQKKAMELQQMYMKMQQELAEAEVKAQAKILKKVQKAASKVAQEKSFDLVLEKSEVAVLYNKSELDLTDEIIKAYGK